MQFIGRDMKTISYYLSVFTAIILLTVISGIAAHDKEYKSLAMITVLMCIFCAAVFVWGLKLQMKLFPWS